MSCMSAEFCDTNIILLYANDSSAGDKRTIAEELLERLWGSGDGALSIQVLQELFTSITRKTPTPLSYVVARGVVSLYSEWQMFEPNSREVLEAIDYARRWNISFWDAMILVAAHKTGASTLWTEDLNDGQMFNGTVVRNPFRQ